MSEQDILEVLRQYAPGVGETWMWEPLKPHARKLVTVTDVKWDQGEVWIQAQGEDGTKDWNTLSRWVEAAVMVYPSDD